jgi:predicted negative regulator of RcsB-dependent stress response
MNKTILSVVLLLGVGGYFGWGYMGTRANDTALTSARVAENRISLAVTGMT